MLQRDDCCLKWKHETVLLPSLSTCRSTPLTVGFYWYWYWHTTWMWVLVVTSELSSTNTSAGGYKWTHRSAQHTICFNQRITTLRNEGMDLSQMMKHTYLMVFVEQHETRMSSQKGWQVKEKRRRNLKQKAFVTIVTTCQRGYTDLHRRCKCIVRKNNIVQGRIVRVGSKEDTKSI